MRKTNQATKPSTPTKYTLRGAKKVKIWNTRTNTEIIKYYGFSTPEKNTHPVFIQGEKPSTLNGVCILEELNYKKALHTPTPQGFKEIIHVTKHTAKNPFYNTFGVLSYKEINQLKTLKLRGGYNTKYTAKLYTKHLYSYRYKAHTKTIKPNTINNPPQAYKKGFIPQGAKLLFRCPICNQTRTKHFNNREISTPTHTHEINNPSINPLNQLFTPTIKSTVNLYLVKLSIKVQGKEINIYDISQKQDTPSIIILEDKPEPRPSTKLHKQPKKATKTPPPIDTPSTQALKHLNQKFKGGDKTKTNTIKRLGFYLRIDPNQAPSLNFWGDKR